MYAGVFLNRTKANKGKYNVNKRYFFHASIFLRYASQTKKAFAIIKLKK
jgi:hypothetical protein